jgi:uncharacterized protein
MLAISIFELNPWHTLAAWPLVLAVVGVIVLGISKSGFGGGLGIVAIPMFAVAFGAKDGTAILLPLLIACDVFSVYHHWKKWDGRILKVLLPGTLLGIGLGAAVLYVMLHQGTKAQGERGLNMVTGVICILYVVADQVRARWAKNWHFRPSMASGSAAGAAVGVISTLAHAAGPVAAIFLLGQALSKQIFVGTMVIYFFFINTTKLIPYAALGLIDPRTLIIGLWLAPLVPIGTWLGTRIFHVIPEALFRDIILAVTLLTGLQLAFGISLAPKEPATQPAATLKTNP